MILFDKQQTFQSLVMNGVLGSQDKSRCVYCLSALIGLGLLCSPASAPECHLRSEASRRPPKNIKAKLATAAKGNPVTRGLWGFILRWFLWGGGKMDRFWGVSYKEHPSR